MPNDQFGKPISVGDTVTIKGEVTKLIEDPNFVNCTVKMMQTMPPSGTEISLQLNTAQLEKTGGAKGESRGAQQSQAQQQQNQPPEHGHHQQPPEQQQAQRTPASQGAKK